MSSRLDVILASRGLCPSREKAKAAIAAGLVSVDGVKATKPSMPVDDEAIIEVLGQACRYVGRGGLKLEHALEQFSISLSGMVCADLGASTGGFTQCMLMAGAARVFAIDVGHGQLDPTLLADPRVVSMEGTDARQATPELLGTKVDFVGADLSFIPLGLVLPSVAALLKESGQAVCLVKPQFEAGRERVGKNGLVRDPAVHEEVLLAITEQARANGLEPVGLAHSPIRGGEGNIEYLLHLVRNSQAGFVSEVRNALIHDVVARAQAEL